MFSFFTIKRVILIIVVILLAYWGFNIFTGQDSWRAVFLTNNQVYFGHFKWIPFQSTIELTDVYYLQVSQPLQQNSQEAQEVRVIKLGSEIHGPEDMMIIPKDSILFWEDLKPDSAIVRRIKELEK
jgi:hypothetical protein